MEMFDMSHITNTIWEMLMEDEVIDKYHDIYLNGNAEEKEKHKVMLFLGDPDFDARKWIKKAFTDFANKSEFDFCRTEINNPIAICIFVKANRQLHKRKLVSTPENLLSEVKSILGMERND